MTKRVAPAESVRLATPVRVLRSRTIEKVVQVAEGCGVFEEKGFEISTLQVRYKRRLHSYDFSQEPLVEGRQKKLFGSKTSPYLAVSFKQLRFVKDSAYAGEIISALESGGVKHVDEPARLVKCQGPNGKEVTVALVKSKNKLDLAHYSQTSEFWELTPAQHLQLIKDIVEGKCLLSRAKLIDLDSKSENILVHRDKKGIHIYYTDLDHAYLFQEGFCTPDKFHRFPVHTDIPGLDAFDTMRKALKTLSWEEISKAYEPIQAYQLGVILYSIFVDKYPYDFVEDWIADMSSSTREELETHLLKSPLSKLDPSIIGMILDLLENPARITVEQAYLHLFNSLNPQKIQPLLEGAPYERN